jgi:hypothetical protein
MTIAPLHGATRRPEASRLEELLVAEEPGLRICGVSGAGGVGKSYLLGHVLEGTDLRKRRYLKLGINGGNDQSRRDFFALIDGQLAARGLPAPAEPGQDYFPQVRKIASIHREILDAARVELAGSGVPPDARAKAMALLRTGQLLNKAVPRTRELLNFQALGSDDELAKTMDEAAEIAAQLKVLRDRAAGPIQNLLGLTRRARVRNDLYDVTAEALLSDLSAALGPYQKRDRFRLLTQRRIEGLDRLLLVFDDFEAVGPVLEEFLVGSLIPRLARASFPTLLVVLGRDDLDAMHPSWSQHCRQFIREQIRLAPFSREEAMELLSTAGVPEGRREEIYRATQGFPFLLTLLIDELATEGADSALFLRKFFDRTTRWMTDREREWLIRVCYLEQVNLDTLARVFPPERVGAIQEWFEREASIRDPGAAVFRVRPLIREKVLRYQELRAPSRHRELLAMAAEPK